jgi:signal peptidase I
VSARLRTALLLAAGLALLPSYVSAYRLSGASEAPTILVGDKFLVNRAAYDLRLPYANVELLRVASPRREDMVLAWLPGVPRPAIKRVAGLPGETVEVRDSRVIVNGAALPLRTLDSASFAWVPKSHRMGNTVALEDGHWIAYTPGIGRDRNTPAVRLGAQDYFLIGDNRDNSLDSRSFGPVARDQILGKVITVSRKGAP